MRMGLFSASPSIMVRIMETTTTDFQLTPAVPCPNCGTDSNVKELFSQATYREGIGGEASKSLGLYAYCPKCDVRFKVVVK